MKQRAATVLLAALLVACKKDRVCNCTVTVDGTTSTRTQITGVPPILPDTDSTTVQPLQSSNSQKKSYKKISKKAMRANCFATAEETLDRTSISVVPGIYTITTSDNGTKTYDCRIELE